MTALIITCAVLVAMVVLIVGAQQGVWAAWAERRRTRPVPHRICGRHHATADERRACEDAAGGGAS